MAYLTVRTDERNEMSKARHTNTELCIWCGEKIPQVSFSHDAHVVPRKLGGSEIGVDVCDDCNTYFGAFSNPQPAVDVALKEVLNTAFTLGKTLDRESYKKYKSAFFSYHHSLGVVILKKWVSEEFFTRQFKRGLFEIFLQKYHKETLDGNNSIFDPVRQFARYNKGNLSVYYLSSNVILRPKDKENLSIIPMSKSLIEDMMKYGMFHLSLFGHNFFLEVFPEVSVLSKEYYLKEQEKLFSVLRYFGKVSIIKLNKITDMDFLMRRFHPDLRMEYKSGIKPIWRFIR